ncbi:uncharacterized protein LOC119453068 isoform X4 [Dermacentor silvarum]|uniref:uncharacterized protein LOC119453068 isoform X4 n=1 Tax=Dermacentor silvarum TaxID=543639 RepID=UPI00210178AE|nr:uncharacterized protein LOC119453068 isoform X4 [Dermacentor silvarum]
MEHEASTSSAAATSAVAKRGRPRQYTADEARERKNAAKRAKRLAAKSTTVVTSPETRRAERAAAQRARRRHEAIRKREAEADRLAKRLKRQDEAFRLREAEAKRIKRQKDGSVRQREAEAKRRKRQRDGALRQREAEAKRRKRQEKAEARRRIRREEAGATITPVHQAAANRFVQAFIENPFGSACSVRDILWFTNDGIKTPEKAHSLLEQHFPVGETLPAADGVKAQTVRVHRTGRSWPLVMCPHHSTSEAEALGVATADFSAVFPDIDFKQAAEVACDKPPFIEDSLVSTTCRVEPWRGLQDKCVGEYEAVLQHAERFCQTEHHITLVQCRKPQVSTCSVEVQADPWCQHHCGIGPIGVDLCET